jgi:hypothetical protein
MTHLSQDVHFKKLITKLDPKGASNVLTCMAGSNIGESKDCIFMVAEDGVTTRSNVLLEEDT